MECFMQTFTNLGNIGLGCLQLGTIDENDAVNLISVSYNLGIRIFDTAAVYGSDRSNEELLGKAIKKIKADHGPDAFIFFSTKCGINFSTIDTESEGYEASPEQIRASVNTSLNKLQQKKIPLLYLHRLNPKQSDNELKKTLNCLKELVEEGKVEYIGLSEPSKHQILTAKKVFEKTKGTRNPFAFVQSACSVATQRAFHNGVYKVCQTNGIQLVTYSSTVRGLVDPALAEEFKGENPEELEPSQIIKRIQTRLNIPDGDFRFLVGFFHKSVIQKNLQCILKFQELAQTWDIPPSELALAWQKEKGMIPIPGTTKLKHLQSNIKAMSRKLSAKQMKAIDDCFRSFQGNPNPPKMLDNEALEVLTG